jgi:hypothetical protein
MSGGGKQPEGGVLPFDFVQFWWFQLQQFDYEFFDAFATDEVAPEAGDVAFANNGTQCVDVEC